jgi:hypothetical protein
MTRLTYVNCRTHRQRKEAKDADRLQPKWHTVRLSVDTMQAHGYCRCGGRRFRKERCWGGGQRMLEKAKAAL